MTIASAPPVGTAWTPDPYYSGGYCLAFLDSDNPPLPAGGFYTGIYRLSGTTDEPIIPFVPSATEIDIVVTGASAVTLSSISPTPTGLPGTAFLGGQLNVWALPFSDTTTPPPPLYGYSYTATGGSPGSGVLNVAGSAIGVWGSQRGDLQRKLGQTNEQIYADTDNSQNATWIVQEEQSAFDEADTMIAGRLTVNQLADTPLTVTGAYQQGQLKLAETYYACAALCEHRGLQAADGNNVLDAQLNSFRARADALMYNLIYLSNNAPSDPNAVPSNTSVTPTSAPQVVRCFNGGSWGWGYWTGACFGWGFGLFGGPGACGGY